MTKPANCTTPQSIAAIRALELKGFQQGLPMMLRAGNAAASFLHERIAPASHVVVLVGPGNNGGDALVAAHALLKLGHRLTVVMPTATPDALTNVSTNASTDGSTAAREALMNWLASGGKVVPDLPTQKPDAAIDGLFGIGLSRPLIEPWQTVINTVNAWQVPVLALDIASGLDAQTGSPLGQPIVATWTLSFIAPSLGVASNKSKPFCGECFFNDLGLIDPCAS